MKVQLFVPCFIDQFYPETAENCVKILKKVGCEIIYNPEQTCCGQPAYNSGFVNEATALANKFIKDFDPNIPIVSPSGSCTSYIKNHYKKLFAGNAQKLLLADKLNNNVFEITDFLVNKLNVTDLGATFNHKVTYHKSCSAIRDYGLTTEPMTLLSNVKGISIEMMEEADTCCGFGGTFAVKHPSISTAMVEKKVENAIATKAEYIVSTEASCLMNINGYCQKHNLSIKGIHIVDILASQI